MPGPLSADDKAHQVYLGLEHQDYLDDDQEYANGRNAENQDRQGEKDFESCFHIYEIILIN